MIAASLSRQLGGEAGWRELEAKLRPFVARRVRSEADVDDVVQDVFSRILRGLASLRDDQRFGPWVYQVARSAIADHRRASARHPAPPRDATGPGAEPAPASENDHPAAEPDGEGELEAAAADLARYAALLVSRLPSPYREALTLTELEGLTQKQAAEMLGVSLSGMKSRVQRGRRLVRAALEECCHIALDARRRVVACEPRGGVARRPASGCC